MNDCKLILTLGIHHCSSPFTAFSLYYKACREGLSFQRGKKAVSAKHHDELWWSAETNVVWTPNRAKEMQVSHYPNVYSTNATILFLGSMYVFASVGRYMWQAWRQSQMMASSSVSWQNNMSLYWARVVGATAYMTSVSMCWCGLLHVKNSWCLPVHITDMLQIFPRLCVLQNHRERLFLPCRAQPLSIKGRWKLGREMAGSGPAQIKVSQ